jgi:hypothetical protein
VTYNTSLTARKEIPMKSFEEALFNALLPVFEGALRAANEAGTVPAAPAQPSPVTVSATVSRPTEMPKAA